MTNFVRRTFFALVWAIALTPSSSFAYYNLGGFWRAPSEPPSYFGLVQTNVTVGGTTTGTPSVSVNYAGPQLAGDLNVVVVFWNGSSSINTIRDSAGNSYSTAVAPASYSDDPDAIDNTQNVAIYYAANIKSAWAGNAVTVTFTGSGADYPYLHVIEYSGMANTSPVDATSTNSGSGLTPTAANVVTTHAADLLLVAAAASVSYLSALPTGYRLTGADSNGYAVAETDLTTTGTYGSSMTQSDDCLEADDCPWLVEAVAFKKSTTQSAPFVLQQSTGVSPADSVSSLQVPFLGGQTAGDVNVVSVESYDGVEPISVTDSAGNTYVEIGATSDGNVTTYYAPNIVAASPGTNTVTVQYSGNLEYLGVRTWEYSGIGACGLDQASLSNSGSGTAGTTSAIATTAAPELLMMFPEWANAGMGPGNSGLRWNNNSGAGGDPDWGADRIVTADGNYTGTMYQAPAGNWDAQLVSFSGNSKTGTPAALAFTSSPYTEPTTWQCSGAVTVQLQNSSGHPVVVSSPTTVNVAGSGLTFFADSACTQPITSFTIPPCSNSASFYFEGETTGNSTITASSGTLTPASQTEDVSMPLPFTWIGGTVESNGCDANWTTGSCWQGGSVPGMNDTATFDGNCTANCSPLISGAIEVSTLWIRPNYAGQITLGANALTTDCGFEQDGGTFTADGGSLLVNNGSGCFGGFTLDGGVFTAPNDSGSFTLGGRGTGFFVSGAPTFNANGGTLTFAENIGTTTEIEPGSIQLNNVVFEGTNDASYGVIGTMSVLGNLTIQNDSTTHFTSCQNGSATIQVSGNVYGLSGGGDQPSVNDCDGNNSPTTLALVGSGTQTLSAAGNALPGNILINSTGTVDLAGSFNVASGWTYQSGTVNAGTSTITFLNASINSGSMQFANVGFGDGASSCEDPVISGTMYVQGNAGLDFLGSGCGGNGLSGGTISLSGNLSVSGDGGIAGGTNVTFTGSGAQTITQSGGTMPSGTIAVNKADSTTIPAEVQAITNSNNTYGETTLTWAPGGGSGESSGNPTEAGNLIAVVIGEAGTAAITGVTDSAGNSYVQAISEANSGALTSIWYLGSSTAGTNSISISGGGGNIMSISVYEVSGVDSYSPIDTTATAAVANSSPTTQAEVTTSYADDFIISGTTVPGCGNMSTANFLFQDPGLEFSPCSHSASYSPQEIATTGASWYVSSPTAAGAAATVAFHGALSTVQLLSDLTLSGGQALNVTSGTLDLNGHNLNGNPVLTVADAFKLQGGETVATQSSTFGSSSVVTYDGSGNYSQLAAGNTYGGNLQFGTWSGGGSGTWTLNAPLSVGDFSGIAGTINAGSNSIAVGNVFSIYSGMTFNAGSSNISVGGTWNNVDGTFNGDSGTVTLTPGATHQILGGPTFNNLTMDDSGDSAADVIYFEPAWTVTVTGTLVLRGNSTNDLQLRSTWTGWAWDLSAPSGITVGPNLDVEDSYSINPINSGPEYIDSGDNTNWNFDGQVFTYTGSNQSFTVPSGVTSITIKMWGAGGAGTSSLDGTDDDGFAGGGGGFATGTLTVTPGQVLTVVVGGGGTTSSSPTSAFGGGGAGPGGNSYATSGGGGGMSAVLSGATYLIIAGGGGGAGQINNQSGLDCSGGAGGGTSGLAGGSGDNSGAGGGGGTQNSGGASGSFWYGGGAGSSLAGCNSNTSYQGGAGGGGYYGGGCGGAGGDFNYPDPVPMAGGGGGGSSYIGGTGLSNASTTAGSGSTAGNASDPDNAGAGAGGPWQGANNSASAMGSNGRVVIYW